MHHWRYQQITKPIIITFVLLFLLLLFIAVWVLLGEFDVLNLNWLVPHNGILWRGKLTSEALAIKLFDRYHYLPEFGYNNAQAFWQAQQNQNIQIINTLSLIFNPWLIVPIVSLVIMAVVLPLLLKLCKWAELDVIPFALSLAMGFSVLIISAAIPKWNDVDVWIIRIAILLSTLLISFVLTNFLLNSFWLKQVYAPAVVKQMQQRDQDISSYRQTLQDLKEQYRQQDKIDSVEVDK
ncbi:MAG: hypothetical protein LBT77_00195 [Mycoplasmataceae bacterium]|nr:hypothetical protein [Mycoplasmataceae bacterium]